MNRAAILATASVLLFCGGAGLADDNRIKDITPEGEVGGWTVAAITDPMDDSVSVALSLNAESAEGAADKPPMMMVTCHYRRKKPAVAIVWKQFMAGEQSNYIRIKTRFDSGEVTASSWSVTKNHHATLYIGATPYLSEKKMAAAADELFQSMLGSHQLKVQATPYNERAVVAVFNLDGLAEAVKPFLESCGGTEKAEP